MNPTSMAFLSSAGLGLSEILQEFLMYFRNSDKLNCQKLIFLKNETSTITNSID